MSHLFGGASLGCLILSLLFVKDDGDIESVFWVLGASAILALLSIAAK